MILLSNIFNFFKALKAVENVTSLKGSHHNFGSNRKCDYYYNLPLTFEETNIIRSSTVVDSDIRDLQLRLKRKLRLSELTILRITSDNGIMIRDDDFQ